MHGITVVVALATGREIFPQGLTWLSVALCPSTTNRDLGVIVRDRIQSQEQNPSLLSYFPSLCPYSVSAVSFLHVSFCLSIWEPCIGWMLILASVSLKE